MEKSEPTLVPQWYRTGGICSTNTNSHHRYSSSTKKDDQGIGLSSRNRLTPSTSDCDSFQYSVLTDTNSNPSYHRSKSFNGSMGYGSPTHPRPYYNFNRRYRDKRQEKITISREKSSNGLDNGHNGHAGIFPIGRSEKDPLSWSQPKVAGRCLEQQPKGVGNDTNNGVSPKNLTGEFDKSSFERDFPSLSVEEKIRSSEIGRVPSTASSTVSQSLPIGTSVTIGGKGWTSALAEVPPIVGSSKPVISSAQQSSLANSVPPAACSNTGLNMAETVAKALSSTHLNPQLSDDTEKLAELSKRQFKHLIPVTPSTPKTSVVGSLERLKTKGARTGNVSVPAKFASHTSQHVNYPNRGTARSESLKTHQVGNFQVLNRERNGSSSVANKVPGPTVTNKSANPGNFVPSPATSCNLKLKPDGIQCTTDKRLSAQGRISFFNTIRNGSSSNNIQQQYSSANSSTTVKVGEQALLMPNDSVCYGKELSGLNSPAVGTTMNGNGIVATHDDSISTEKVLSIEDEESSTTYSDIPDEEEINFLRSLGWKEGSGEEALTPEEIDAFVRESGHLLNSVKNHCPQR